MSNKKQMLSKSILGGTIIITENRRKRKYKLMYNDYIVRSFGTLILIVFVCLHFFLSYYLFNENYKKNNNNYAIKYLDYGFGRTTLYQISLIFFVIGLILIVVEFVIIKGWWKIIVFLFSILFVIHYLIFLNYNTIVVDLIFWISLGVNSIVVIFYKK